MDPAFADSAVVSIQGITAVVDSTSQTILLSPEQGKILADWVIFMQHTPSRMLVEGSVGGIFGLMAYAVMKLCAHLQVGSQPRAFLAAIAGGLGAVISFFIAHFIPGMDQSELAMWMSGLGGGGSYLLTKGDASMKSAMVTRREAEGKDLDPNIKKPMFATPPPEAVIVVVPQEPPVSPGGD
jgi:hypothetical protein